MSRCHIFLDESGDLGFNFSGPYRAGGSSRHLTLSGVVCDDGSRKYVSRFMTNFYAARGIPHGTELKWADMADADRLDFAKRASRLCATHKGIRYHSITVYKQRVLPHIQADPNKLYNFMTQLMLLPVMRNFDEVLFIPDSRSIRVKSGDSLHDYLQTKLWFEVEVATKLSTMPHESKTTKELQFADYVCGAFQSHYEDGRSDPRDQVLACTKTRSLFFP